MDRSHAHQCLMRATIQNDFVENASHIYLNCRVEQSNSNEKKKLEIFHFQNSVLQTREKE